MNRIYGKWPGVVVSYDGASRTCRVQAEGITDGSSELLEAVFCNPLGDRPADTEIRIVAGDLVWLEFETGDQRFPIIVGYRTPRAGNPVDWRRWRHRNIETTADETHIINAKNLIFRVAENVSWEIGGDQNSTIAGAMNSTAATSTHQAGTHAITAETSIVGGIATSGGNVSMSGDVAFTGGSLTHDGVNMGSTHTHTEQGDGAEVSTPH